VHPLTNHAIICVSESATSGSVTCAFVSQCEISLCPVCRTNAVPARFVPPVCCIIYHVCCMSGRLLGYTMHGHHHLTITNENDGVRGAAAETVSGSRLPVERVILNPNYP